MIHRLFSFTNKDETLKNLNSEDFHNSLKSDVNAVLIDTRTPTEFDECRIPNAILMDVTDPAFPEKMRKLDKSKNYYLYCHSGSRSYYAGKEMLKMGFDRIFNLKNGIYGYSGEIEY